MPQLPPPCNPDIFQKGIPILLLTGPSHKIEALVSGVAAKAQSQTDWHYSGGVAQILHLGDDASLKRTVAAFSEAFPTMDPAITIIDGGPLKRHLDDGTEIT